jgi:excisionase family DNA binding protein
MAAMMSTKALAEHLGVPVNTIYQWRVRGAGPRAARIGRHLRWSVEEVERWIAQQTEPERPNGHTPISGTRQSVGEVDRWIAEHTKPSQGPTPISGVRQSVGA